MSKTSPYFGQKNVDIPTSNPYVGTPPTSGYANNPVAANQYYQLLNQTIPTNAAEYGKRRMMKWLVPERGIIEMYINPQNIVINNRKDIISERTKGGFIIQYWGEALTDISISGHTGSSGIEGINVLMDVYRGEQIAFDVIALEEATKLRNEEENFIDIAIPGLGEIVDLFEGMGEAPAAGGIIEIPKPTLAYYAASIEMYWMGEVYRGYFESFSVTESTSELGIFKYDMKFKATQRRGYRRNYLAWQKTPLSGPSDHDTIPFTYEAKAVPPTNSNAAKALQRAQAIADAERLLR